MSETKGKILIDLQDTGSKSQGAIAKLQTPEGKTYILYRENTLPQDDPYFEKLDNSEVTVIGDIEEANSYICVESIILADGTQLLPPKAAPSTAILFLDEPTAQPAATKSFKRLPRKLKKQLKKQKKNNI